MSGGTARAVPGLDFSGKRVLITGGSRGIGAACCRMFAGAGAAVCIAYRNHTGIARELLKELKGISDAPHFLHAADVATRAGVASLFAKTKEEWGSLDCLVNNAGIWEANPLTDFDEWIYRRTMEVNVTGSFLCMQEALPLFEGVEDPNVVNVTSTAGQRGEAGYSHYAASKGAMISATKSWSSELAPRVRVNSVAPGWVDTDMCEERFADGGREEIAATVPLRRVASPEDVAGPILFLASGLARHVTGEVLNVNGGSVLVG